MIRLFENDRDIIPKIATIGFFDGVHGGHRYLLDKVRQEAERRNLRSMAVTFENHPRLFFNPDCGLHLLSLPDEKMNLMADTGVDYCLMMRFDAGVAGLTSGGFMKMLAEKYGVCCLMMGYDHRFGSNRGTCFEDYVREGRDSGIDVVVCDGFSEADVMVSSSKVRKALATCNIRLANRLLGYGYTVAGRVVDGCRIGRKIGFPTANLDVDCLKLIPADGVYAVWVRLGEERYKGMLNIGRRPTVNGDDTTVEVHLIDFYGDLYGRYLELEFVDFVRREEKFASLESLQGQLTVDMTVISRILSADISGVY